MAVNFAGPYQLRLRYGVNGDDHTVKFNVDVDGQPTSYVAWNTINLIAKDTTLLDLPTWSAAFRNAIGAMLPTSWETGTFELYRIAPNSNDATFISSDSTIFTGQRAITAIPDSQTTLTFRTQEGGIAKVVMLGVATDITSRGSLANPPSHYADIVTMMTESNSPILGRDTSPIVTSMNWLLTQNERLYKKLYRS